MGRGRAELGTRPGRCQGLPHASQDLLAVPAHPLCPPPPRFCPYWALALACLLSHLLKFYLLSRHRSDTPAPGRLSWAPQLGGPFPCLVLLSVIESSSERDPGPCLLLKPREGKWIASEERGREGKSKLGGCWASARVLWVLGISRLGGSPMCQSPTGLLLKHPLLYTSSRARVRG